MLIFTRELKLICRQWYGKLPIFFDIHKCSGMFTLGQVQINAMSANSWKFQQIDLFPHCFAHLHKCTYVFASPILPHNRFHLICQRNDLLDGWELRRKRFHSHRPYEIDLLLSETSSFDKTRPIQYGVLQTDVAKLWTLFVIWDSNL